ncbi:MAG: hypothetical protein RIQ70_637, partial [Bacteroidota bacterium]
MTSNTSPRIFNKYLVITLFFISTFNTNLFAQACNTPWDAGAVYTGGNTVSYAGRNYTAKNWTQADQPDQSGQWGNWTDDGVCASCTTLPGSIGSAQTISTNTAPNTLTNSTSASGGDGSNYNYQWQKSTNNSTWTDISGATLPTYSPGTLTTNTYYRRKVTSGTCGDAFTTSILITVVVNLDSDSDGIPNSVDLDDDNDGILDAIECPGMVTIPVSQDGLSAATAFESLLATKSVQAAGIYYFKINGNSFTSYVNANGYVLVALDYGNGAGALPQVGSLDNTTRGMLTPALLATFTKATEIKISDSRGFLDAITGNATLISKLTQNLSLNIGQQDLAYQSEWLGLGYKTLTRASNSGACYDGALLNLHENIFWPCGDPFGFHWQPGKNYQRLEYSSGTNTGEIPDGESFRLWVKEGVSSCPDTDNDGIANYLDLDSDGDGCADAIEGDAALEKSDLIGKKLAGNVDANGVPLLAGINGQAVGSSADAVVKDAACDVCDADTDNDGVCNTVDLDDDNDGILDCVENGFDQVSLTNVFNITGNANYISGTEIQLTPDLNSQAGSATSFGKIDFNKDFNFNIELFLGTNDGGADGLAIIFHNDPNGINTVGRFGSGLGASDIQNGMAIEFDTWDNGEVPEDHTQIKLTSTWADLNSLTKLPNIEDGQWHLVNFQWNASANTLTYSFDGNLISNYTNDLVANV